MSDIPTADVLRSELRDYIEKAFLYMHPGVELSDDDQMLALGVIDSLGFVELVEEVQQRYGISVQDVEITEDNFGSISALTTYIEGKRS